MILQLYVLNVQVDDIDYNNYRYGGAGSWPGLPGVACDAGGALNVLSRSLLERGV